MHNRHTLPGHKMDNELSKLINRTRLAAERADQNGFIETAQGLRSIVFTLWETDSTISEIHDAFQYTQNV
ncbi:MAG: hypothetical protein ACJAXK_000022 [Yoonia sp.]